MKNDPLFHPSNITLTFRILKPSDLENNLNVESSKKQLQKRRVFIRFIVLYCINLSGTQPNTISRSLKMSNNARISDLPPSLKQSIRSFCKYNALKVRFSLLPLVLFIMVNQIICNKRTNLTVAMIAIINI